MITTSQIRAAIRAYLITATSLEVFYANQAGPRPPNGYATVLITSILNIGWDDRGEINGSGIQDLQGDRVAQCSLQFFGDTALDKARDAWAGLYKEVIRATLKVAGLTPRKVTAINNITALLETEWEPRAQFDVGFGFVDEYTDDVGLIEHVELTGTYEEGNKTHGPYTWQIDNT